MTTSKTVASKTKSTTQSFYRLSDFEKQMFEQMGIDATRFIEEAIKHKVREIENSDEFTMAYECRYLDKALLSERVGTIFFQSIDSVKSQVFVNLHGRKNNHLIFSLISTGYRDPMSIFSDNHPDFKILNGERFTGIKPFHHPEWAWDEQISEAPAKPRPNTTTNQGWFGDVGENDRVQIFSINEDFVYSLNPVKTKPARTVKPTTKSTPKTKKASTNE